MVRIRCGISLVAMGAAVLGTPIILPATAGKAMGAPLVSSGVASAAYTTQAQSPPQIGYIEGNAQPSQTSDDQVDSQVQALPQIGDVQGNAQPEESSQIDNSQGNTQSWIGSGQGNIEAQQSASVAGTSMEISGPFSANVSWGEDRDATGTLLARDKARSVSVTATIGDANATQTSNQQVTIDWGDGTTTSEMIGKQLLNKEFHISGTHVYSSAGTFLSKLTIGSDNDNQVTATRSIVVP